ncbi:MAG: DUF971 domain-containing protein [Thermoanaerobaculia bacterium]
MKPKFIDVMGSELALVWEDGHESYFPLDYLRKRCPCAYCAGEPDLFGNVSKPPEEPLTPLSFQLSGIERVGNYGLQLNWADRHQWGIWTFERLRSLCPCEACRSRSEGEDR